MSGALAALKALLRREAPAQEERAIEALRRAAATGNEHSVVGPAISGRPGKVTTSGKSGSVMPNLVDVTNAMRADEPAFDFHTHPAEGPFSVVPSVQDYRYWSGNFGQRGYGGDRRLRAFIASPPTRDPDFDNIRLNTGHFFYETDDPARVFDAQRRQAARFELQNAMHSGKFDTSIRREYEDLLDNYQDPGDMMDFLSPLALLKLYSRKGYGRGSFRMQNHPLSPSGEERDQSFMDLALPIMTDHLGSKGFRHGGVV